MDLILAPKPTTKKTTKHTTTTSTTTTTMSTTKAPVQCIMHGCTRCMTMNYNLASINNQVCFALIKSKSSSHIKNPIEKVKSICKANDGILPPNVFYTGLPPMTTNFYYLWKKNFPTLKKTVAEDGNTLKKAHILVAPKTEDGLLCQVKATKKAALQTKTKVITTTTTTTTTTTSTTTTTTTTTKITFSTTTSTTTSTATTMSEKYFQTQFYIQSIERRLKNFERLLGLKIKNFNEPVPLIDAKPRLIWLMVTEDLVRKYVERHEKREKVSNIESIFKLIATVFLLGFFLSLLYIFYQMYQSLMRKYETKKVAKQKRKKILKKKRKRTLSKQ